MIHSAIPKLSLNLFVKGSFLLLMVDGHTSGIMQLALFLAEEGQPQGQGRVPTQPLNGEARTVLGHPLKLRLATQIHAQLTDRGPHGVHGDIVVKHVVEEPENVIERAQTRPQVTEGRTVLDLLQLLKVAILSIVQLPVRGLPGVPGENVPLRVVEELMNVTERVQTRPQAMEERTVSGLQLLHNTAIAFIVQLMVPGPPGVLGDIVL